MMTEDNLDYQIAGLLAKAFTGTLSPEEKAMLDQWREGHEELYALILSASNKAGRDQLISEISVDEGWKKVSTAARIGGGKRKAFMRWGTVAAVIVLCLGIGGGLFWMSDSIQLADIHKSSVVETGSAKAMLITADGKEILLQDTTTRKIALEKGIVAFNDGRKVRYTAENPDSVEEKEVQYNTIKVPEGGEYELLLSDHTKIWLNSATELRFPVHFHQDCREVFLNGEAFFSVSKDEKRPFIVKIGQQVSVEVLGTEFNVMAYEEDCRIEATLNKGKVRVTDAYVTVDLMPNQQAVYDKTQKQLSARQVEAEKYSAWKDGKFVFENASLESIMIRLSRWYNIHVFYQHPEAKEFHFTGDLERYRDFDQTLKMLEKATNVHFSVHHNNVVVSVK